MNRISQIRGARSMFLVAIAAGSIGSALAEDIKVKLSGAEETPAVETSASGSGTFSISADKTLSGEVKTSGIQGTAAHIHAGAPGEKGPPVITLAQASDGAWTVPADSKLTDEQYAALKAGKLYVNVHSADHKPGEIRGQLTP
jgi:hypothetical protein